MNNSQRIAVIDEDHDLVGIWTPGTKTVNIHAMIQRIGQPTIGHEVDVFTFAEAPSIAGAVEHIAWWLDDETDEGEDSLT